MNSNGTLPISFENEILMKNLENLLGINVNQSQIHNTTIKKRRIMYIFSCSNLIFK